jgi:hypothetical protein
MRDPPVRFARMLTNAVIGGLAVAAYLTILVLHLNPRFPLSSLPSLSVTIAFSYGVNVAAAFYVLVVLRQLLATELLSPGWISFRFLVWISALAATIGSALMWANLRGFRSVLAEATVRRMTGAAAALTACAVVCVVLVVIHRWSGRRSTRAGAAILAITLMLSLAVPLTLRGPGIGTPKPGRVLPPPPTVSLPGSSEARVTVIAFEGASLDIIVPAAAQGRLPHFARLLESGASLHVATLKPTQPIPVWTAAATGKLPAKNGIRSAAMYWPLASRDGLELLPDYCFAHALVRFGFLEQRVHESTDLTALPLWSILSSQGVSVGVVNWSATNPVRRVEGYLVSDQFRGRQESWIELAESDAIWPREAASVAVGAAQQRAASYVQIPPKPAIETSPPTVTPCDADRAFEQIAATLDRQMPARFRAIRYECLDVVGHYYLRYTVPGAFGDVSEDELRRYGGVLMAQYGTADRLIGDHIATMSPGDLLVVISGFGMAPIDPGKRLLERAFGNPEMNGTHERAPDGFMVAYGTQVRPGQYERASIVDLVPTLLYYLGLPVGRDMDGHARTDLFQRSLTDLRPITYIPTYER